MLRLGCAHGARTARLFAREAWAIHWLCLWRGAFGGPSPVAQPSPCQKAPLPEGFSPVDSLRFAFDLCAAVLQCAPRARTKGRGVLRTWQSASKDVPATGKGRERFAIITTLSPARRPPVRQQLRSRRCRKRRDAASPRGADRSRWGGGRLGEATLPGGNRQCLNWQLATLPHWQHWQLATLAIGNIGNWQHCPRGYLRRAAWAAARRAIGTRNGEQLT